MLNITRAKGEEGVLKDIASKTGLFSCINLHSYGEKMPLFQRFGTKNQSPSCVLRRWGVVEGDLI